MSIILFGNMHILSNVAIYCICMGLFSHGILGINKRNLHYILKKNPSHAIRLANNKTATKEHLSSSGIQFAETYALIKNPRELRDFDFDSFPQRDFVIKPNKGSK